MRGLEFLLALLFMLTTLSVCPIRADDLDSTIDHHYRILVENPENVPIIRELASLLTQEERYIEAAVLYLALLDHDPGDRQLRLSLARVQSWAGLFEESIRNYRILIDPAEPEEELRIELARVLSWSRRYPESIAIYEDILRENGTDESVRLEYARVLSWSGDYGASSRIYRDYLAGSGNGDHHGERLELARVLSWGGSYERSRVEYMRLIDEDPEEADLHAELGDVYRWAGRVDLARSRYRTSLRLDETNERAIEGLENLRMTWNRLELVPGFDDWNDSEGFGLNRAELMVRTHPWEIATLAGGIRKDRMDQFGGSVDALSFAVSFQTPFLGKFKGYGEYRNVDYESLGRRHNYSAKIEYLHNLKLAVGLVSSRNEIVHDVFNIRSLTDGAIQSRNLMAYLLSRSREGLSFELVGQVGDQTDDNRRTNGRAVLTYMIASRPYIALRYRLLYLGYRERSDRYWDPGDYVSNMGLGHVVYRVEPVELEVEGGIGRGRQDGVGNNEYSLVLGGNLEFLPGSVLTASYAKGRTGRLFEDSNYTFSRFTIRLTQKL